MYALAILVMGIAESVYGKRQWRQRMISTILALFQHVWGLSDVIARCGIITSSKFIAHAHGMYLINYYTVLCRVLSKELGQHYRHAKKRATK